MKIIEPEKEEELINKITPSTVPGNVRKRRRLTVKAKSAKRSSRLLTSAPDDPGPEGNSFVEKN